MHIKKEWCLQSEICFTPLFEVYVLLDFYIIFDYRYDIKSKLPLSQSDLDLRNLAVRPGHFLLQKHLARTEYLDH